MIDIVWGRKFLINFLNMDDLNVEHLRLVRQHVLCWDTFD